MAAPDRACQGGRSVAPRRPLISGGSVRRPRPDPRDSAPAGCGEEKVVSAKASSQLPVVLAREYSVERFSKKLVCSTAFSISSSQGSGFFSMP